MRCHTQSKRRLFPGYDTRFSLHDGCCCQSKEVAPLDHIKGKGCQSSVTFGLKIRLTTGIGPRLLGLSRSSLHSPRCAFLLEPFYLIHLAWWWLGLPASHSAEGPLISCIPLLQRTVDQLHHTHTKDRWSAASHSYKGPLISCITLLQRTLLPWSIVYFHHPIGTVCTGDVRLVQSAKMVFCSLLFFPSNSVGLPRNDEMSVWWL